jgi:hypothetical protein
MDTLGSRNGEWKLGKRPIYRFRAHIATSFVPGAGPSHAPPAAAGVDFNDICRRLETVLQDVTSGPPLAIASRNWAQSRSHHCTSIVTAGHLHTTQSPISSQIPINNIKQTHFLPLKTCLKGAIFSPAGTHTCVPVHYTGTHICVHIHCTGMLLSMPVHHTGAHKCVPSKPTGVHLCAPVQLTGAPLGRALNPLSRAPMHV